MLRHDWDSISPINHEIAEIQSGRVFEIYDEDRDGYLNYGEYRVAMASLGFKPPSHCWMSDYVHVCERTGCFPNFGLTRRAFQHVCAAENAVSGFLVRALNGSFGRAHLMKNGESHAGLFVQH